MSPVLYLMEKITLAVSILATFALSVHADLLVQSTDVVRIAEDSASVTTTTYRTDSTYSTKRNSLEKPCRSGFITMRI